MIDKHPITFCIFGATGDLAKNKLLPALFNLYKRNLLTGKFNIVALSRRDWQDAEYYDFVRKSFENKKVNNKDLEKFLKKFRYFKADLDDRESYKNLNNFLAEIDNKLKVCSHKVFYLAITPEFYKDVFKNLAKSGLTISCREGDGDGVWNRILVEKPFGKNRKEAKKLDQLLGSLYKEEQIFRIDHYLAKHTLESLISFRISNVFFESAWNKNYINKIEFKLYESKDIDNRSAFYEGIGALRDVGQNHLLQMAALLMMDLPKDLSSTEIRNNRKKFLKSLKFDLESSKRAQYKGYRNLPFVAKNSKTETYFKIKGQSSDSRWKNVLLTFESGKALETDEVSITVYFKKNPNYPELASGYEEKNYIKFNIQPKESTEICFWSKKPGHEYETRSEKFILKEEVTDNLNLPPDAYERVLYDALKGDQSLFVSTDEVHLEWKAIMPILDYWSKKPRIKFYKKGNNQIFN